MGEAHTGRSVQRGGVSSPGLMIDLPVWSTLMLEFEAFRLTIGHDREPCTPPLTSTEVSRSARLITRPLASVVGSTPTRRTHFRRPQPCRPAAGALNRDQTTGFVNGNLERA